LTQKQTECDDYRQKYLRCEAVLKSQDVTELEIKRLKDMIEARNMEIENLRLASGEAKEWELRA
jgi:DNA repair ATPase RecN